MEQPEVTTKPALRLVVGETERRSWRISYAAQKKLAYLAFVGLFGVEITSAVLLNHLPQFDALRWGMFAFGVFRLSRLIAWDGVLQPLRDPFTRVVPHDSGAGDTTEARTDRGAFVEVVGELITCPICNGTHATMLLLLLDALVPALVQVLITMLAVVGAVEMLMGVYELAQWRGERERHETGPIMRRNRGG